MSFDVILPFLRPIEHLIQDPEVSEVMVNGSRRVFVERHGEVKEAPGVEISESSFRLRSAISLGRKMGEMFRPVRRPESRIHAGLRRAVLLT